MNPYSWHVHWSTLVFIAAVVALYLLAQRRWPSDTRRRVAFDLGVLMLLAVYVTPLHTIALNYLLCIHLLQNVVTAEWAPGLIVFAISPALARELERSTAFRFVTHPLFALPFIDQLRRRGEWRTALAYIGCYAVFGLFWPSALVEAARRHLRR